MVKYIIVPAADSNIEDVMRDVNNYINFHQCDNISESLRDENMSKSFEEFYQLVAQLNSGYEITPYNPIPFQGRFARIKGFIKRIIRKCIGWYVADICQQQICVNANMVRAINQQMYVNKRIEEENRYLRKHIEKITEELQDQKRG